MSAAPLACAHCAKPGAQSSCARCKLVRYCGKACQAEHWKRGCHKVVCGKNPLELMAMAGPLSKKCDQLSAAHEWTDLVDPQKRLLAASQLVGDPQQERSACGGMHGAYMGTGDFHGALRCSVRELQLAARIGNAQLSLIAQQRQMQAQAALQLVDEALQSAEAVLRLLPRCSDDQEIVAAKQAVAVVFGKFQPTKPELAERARVLLAELPPIVKSDARELASRLQSLGNAAAQDGDFTKAAQLFQQSVEAAPTAIAYKCLADVAWSIRDAARRTAMLHQVGGSMHNEWRCMHPLLHQSPSPTPSFPFAISLSSLVALTEQAAQIAMRKKGDTDLQHQVVILGAWHNDLSANGKHYEAAALRPELSALCAKQSTTGAFGGDCSVCHEACEASEACWVLQHCRHLLHHRCLKEWARRSLLDRRQPSCPLCRAPISNGDLMRGGILSRDGQLLEA